MSVETVPIPAEDVGGPGCICGDYSELERLGGRVEKARCHSCNDPSKPVAGNRSFEGEGSIAYPVCAECMEGIDAYGEPT